MPSLALSSAQVSMLRRVIDAAQTGRYCHGNGADWVIVDESRTRVIALNHVTGTESVFSDEDSARYLASTPAHSSETTVTSLTSFIS
jgi:hypothetical protein